MRTVLSNSGTGELIGMTMPDVDRMVICSCTIYYLVQFVGSTLYVGPLLFWHINN